MIAVFSASSTLLPAGADTRIPDAIAVLPEGEDTGFPTSPTFFEEEPTDIAEDFFVRGGGTLVVVPEGATTLFVAASDNFYLDNRDEDGDFRIVVQ